MCVLAISSCLQLILQDNKLPKKLPQSMSCRMKIASNLSDHIKHLGFHGDLGYSTILYGSEIDIRNILIFLIERLPKDPPKTTAAIQTGYAPNLLKEIDDNLQLYLKHLWIPPSLLHNGIREFNTPSFSIHSFGNSIPLLAPSAIISSYNSEREGKFVH